MSDLQGQVVQPTHILKVLLKLASNVISRPHFQIFGFVSVVRASCRGLSITIALLPTRRAMTTTSTIVRPELSLDGSVDELFAHKGTVCDAAVTPPGGDIAATLAPSAILIF